MIAAESHIHMHDSTRHTHSQRGALQRRLPSTQIIPHYSFIEMRATSHPPTVDWDLCSRLHIHTLSLCCLFFANESLYFCNVLCKVFSRCVLALCIWCLFNANTQKQAKPFAIFTHFVRVCTWNSINTDLGSFFRAKERNCFLIMETSSDFIDFCVMCRI